MTHLDTKLEAISEANLKLMLPKPGPITVASAAVGQDEQVIGVGIFDRADHLPPATDGGHGKLGGVAACADVDKSLIPEKNDVARRLIPPPGHIPSHRKRTAVRFSVQHPQYIPAKSNPSGNPNRHGLLDAGQ